MCDDEAHRHRTQAAHDLLHQVEEKLLQGRQTGAEVKIVGVRAEHRRHRPGQACTAREVFARPEVAELRDGLVVLRHDQGAPTGPERTVRSGE